MRKTQETLEFASLEPREVPVVIDNQEYVLREPSGSDGCKYRACLINATQETDGANTTNSTSLSEADPLLVSLCLRKQNGKEGSTAVGVEEVKSWPDRIITKLYEKCREIGEMDQSEEEVKNLQESMVGGSS